MANIKNHLNNIKNALFGQEVRGSIHDGIDAMNKEVESTTNRQKHLEDTFDQLTINAGNSNAEIVDARVGENGKSYSKLGDRLDSFDSQLEHIEDNILSIKSFGAKCDGVSDDSESIKKAINYVLSNNLSSTIVIDNEVYINKNISIDCMGKTLNIKCNGNILADVGGYAIDLYNFKYSNIHLNFKNFGNSESCGLRIRKCNSSFINVIGNGYKGTLLFVDGNKNINEGVTSMTIKLKAINGCYKALQHGRNLVEYYQDGFGTYEQIIDFDSLTGIEFNNSSDITIQHIENHYIGDNSSVLFNSCGAIHLNIIAIGGKCPILFKNINSNISINKLYTCNEKYNTDDDNLIGLYTEGSNAKTIVYYYDGGTTRYLINKDTNSFINVFLLKNSRNDGEITINNVKSSLINGIGNYSYNSLFQKSCVSTNYKLPQEFSNLIKFIGTNNGAEQANISCWDTEWALNHIKDGNTNKMMYFRSNENNPYLNINRLDVTGTLLVNSKPFSRARKIEKLATSDDISVRLNQVIQALIDAGLMNN